MLQKTDFYYNFKLGSCAFLCNFMSPDHVPKYDFCVMSSYILISMKKVVFLIVLATFFNYGPVHVLKSFVFEGLTLF